MTRWLLPLALITLAAPGLAQSGSEAARAIILAAYKPTDAKQSFVDNYVLSFEQGLQKNVQAAAAIARRPGLKERLSTTVRREAGIQYDVIVGPALTGNLTRLYEANFTNAELNEMANYYRSPEAQKLLMALSRKAPADEIAAAQASPVVQRYAASAAARKERGLNGQIATAMTQGMIDHADEVNAAIMPKVRATMQAAATPTRSKAK